MGFHLRLVRTGKDESGIESAQEMSQKLLSLLSVAKLDFPFCLDLCREQSDLTKAYNYLKFAKANRDFFASYFVTAEKSTHPEEGLKLVNLVIMLTYLRKVDLAAYRGMPVLLKRALTSGYGQRCHEKISVLLDQLATNTFFPTEDGQLGEEEVMLFEFKASSATVRKKIRRVLGRR
jgi:hypothetical protein